MTGEHGSRLVERRRPGALRRGEFLVFVVGRPLMFVAWMLVLWGTAVALAALYVLVTRGGRAASTVLLPRTPLDLVNAGLAVLAVIVWTAVLVIARRTPPED